MRFIKLMLLVVFSVVLCNAAVGAASDYAMTDALKVSIVNQDPDPVEPGKYVDVRLKVENFGTDAASGVELEFLPNFPFSLDSGADASIEIGTISALQKDDRAAIVKYKVRVNENAVEGTNKIKIRSRSEKTSWSTYEFDINVRTIDANLAIESVTTTPSVIEPGKDAVVKIKVKNMADSLLTDISLRVDLLLTSFASSASATAASASSTGLLDILPFAPMDSGTEKKIRKLSPGEEVVFSYGLMVYPEAESKIYKVPIQLEYFDALGTEYTQDDIIGLVVNSEPDISVVLDDSTITSSGDRGEVSFKFVNKGLSDIKFMNVVLNSNDKFDVLSGNEIYLGNIDSDDYETADFDIFVKPNGDEDIFLLVDYEYMDANNNKYEKTKEVRLALYSDDEAKNLGVDSEDNSKMIAVIVVVLVVIGALIFFAVRRRKKRS
ncbi:COG1361 S-layer family protein [Candidatus Woesearchaeota archaeon]|nr:COG1361 S-layer family protein [Candidatus Woesearchaeota archaeon]